MKAVVLLIAGMLTACQSAPERGPEHRPPASHRGVGTGAGASGAMGSGTASGMGKDSWYGMCAMLQRITEARTPEERQALVEKEMPGLSQETREQQLQLMRERCR